MSTSKLTLSSVETVQEDIDILCSKLKEALQMDQRPDVKGIFPFSLQTVWPVGNHYFF